MIPVREEKHPLSPAPELEKAPEKKAPAKQGGHSVFQYIAILFAAAFALLLFTFVMEKRQNDLLQQQNQEQIDNLQQSVSAVQSLDNLYKENAALKEKVDELEAQAKLQAAQAQQAAKLESDLDNTKRAMDWFWQIDEAYVSGKTRLCRSLIQSLEDAGLRAFLPTESTTDNGRFSPADRYQEIYDALF